MGQRNRRLIGFTLASVGIVIACSVLGLAVISLVSIQAVAASNDGSLACVDQNRNGIIDKDEAINVVLAYLSGEPIPAPTSGPTPGPSDRAATLSRLMRNAEEFEYAIGKHGGRLTYTTIGGPLTFNLAISTDSSSSAVLDHLFEGLTQTSWLTNRVEPSLAESWEHSDDGLTWTFHLRNDVRWHDGTPFTSHDVEFTFNRIIYNDDIPASSRSSFIFRVQDDTGSESRIARMTVTALDNHTVQIVLPTPFAPFLRSMGTAIYPRHIPGTPRGRRYVRRHLGH